jgi:hypothetical protein
MKVPTRKVPVSCDLTSTSINHCGCVFAGGENWPHVWFGGSFARVTELSRR